MSTNEDAATRDRSREMVEVARIIDPAAFAEGWATNTAESTKLIDSRLAYQKAVALSKAHSVLSYLGLTQPVDWLSALEALAENEPAPLKITKVWSE